MSEHYVDALEDALDQAEMFADTWHEWSLKMGRDPHEHWRVWQGRMLHERKMVTA